MNKHHQWCSRFGTITEGVCMECERLNRQYPALGHLEYTDEFLVYFPESEIVTKEECHARLQNTSNH